MSRGGSEGREGKAQGEEVRGEEAGGSRELGALTWRMSSSMLDRYLLFSSRSSQGQKALPL